MVWFPYPGKLASSSASQVCLVYGCQEQNSTSHGGEPGNLEVMILGYHDTVLPNCYEMVYYITVLYYHKRRGQQLACDHVLGASVLSCVVMC